MPFDFKSLPTRAGFETIRSPREIFNALPERAEHLEYLRDSQGSVLEAWASRRDERDLVIKINTGGGKTVVGLLILQACLNDGVGPALYVAPDKYLVEQVRREARDLGLETTADPEDPRYLEGKIIAVVNIYRLMNGMSVFGGPGSGRPSHLPIGSLVVDDVHAALATATDQFTMRFPYGSTIYDKLRDLFRDSLREQSPGSFTALEAGDSSVLPQIVPFWAWTDRADEVTSLLQQNISEDEVKWKWPLLRDHIQLCRVAFTARNVEIAPPCLPVSGIAGYREARRRVFLTATLADDSVLVTMFDADPTSIGSPITPESASDQGDRLILAPQEINHEISEADIKQASAALATRVNVVVLVPSQRRADYWGDVAAEIATSETIGTTVEQLRTGHVGLVVFVNKYDGIDLPGKACEVLVIDGLPEVYGSLERRDASVLGTGDTIFDRQMQRIEQGMGRGVRGANDYCVVLLHGSRLTQRVSTPSLRDQFSPLTRAQLDLSREVAGGLARASMAELLEVVEQVLARDKDWIAASRAKIAGVSYGAGIVTQGAAAMRAAFNLADAQQYGAAADIMSTAVSNEPDAGMKGLLRESLATYANFTDQARAQQVLASGIRENSRIVRPLRGFTYQRTSPHADQARAVADHLGDLVSSGSDLILRVRAVLEDLVFDPERTAEFENAIEELGKICGFRSARPERDSGNGPDNLWAPGGLEYLVIECKSGATSAEIHRKDAEQLGHSMVWFEELYDPSCSARPIMVHPSDLLAVNASVPARTRIITRSRLSTLREHVLGFAEALATSAIWTDTTEIATRLQHFHLNSGQIAIAHSVPSRRVGN